MLQLFKRPFLKWMLTVLCCWPVITQVQGKSYAERIEHNLQLDSIGEVELILLDSIQSQFTEGDSIKKRNKFIAAILAFPYPFGMFGLHRMYLGVNPIIPILYIVTIGGLVGIVPFIDMMVLLLSKDTKPFRKNSKILMWYKDNS